MLCDICSSATSLDGVCNDCYAIYEHKYSALLKENKQLKEKIEKIYTLIEPIMKAVNTMSWYMNSKER